MTQPEVRSLTVNEALDALESQYHSAVDALRTAITAFIADGSLPDPAQRAAGLFVYPQLRVKWNGSAPSQRLTRAFGRFTRAGCYSTTITRPSLLRHYLSEQLNMLSGEYPIEIAVLPSQQEILPVRD